MNPNFDFSLSLEQPSQNRERANSFVLERPKIQVSRKKLSFDDDRDDESVPTNDTDSYHSGSFMFNMKKNLSEAPTLDLLQKQLCSTPMSDHEIFFSPTQKSNSHSHRSLIMTPVAEATQIEEAFPSLIGDREKMICEDGQPEEQKIQIENEGEDFMKKRPRFSMKSLQVDDYEVHLPKFPEFRSPNPEPKTHFSFANKQTSQSLKSTPNNGDFDYPKRLPTTCKNLKNPDLNGITPETLSDLIKNPKGLNYLIVDCRYDYEYRGGHIQGAINITSPEQLEELFIKNRHLIYNPKALEELKHNFQGTLDPSLLRFKKEEALGKEFRENGNNLPIIIFHCEFSQKRGPRTLRALRNLDRQLNQHDWPKLYYPEIYILEGGYRDFVTQFPELCQPQGAYIEMIDKNYRGEYSQARENELMCWKRKGSMESIVEENLRPRAKTTALKLNIQV